MNRSFRTLLTIVMNLLTVLAVLLVARVIVLFFHSTAVMPIGKAIVQLTALMVAPLHLGDVKNSYGGSFDVNATITVVIALAAEWVLGMVRADD